jgi:hypothetical protein
MSFRKAKVNTGNQLRTSRKFKVANFKNNTLFIGGDAPGVSIKPLDNNPQILEVNNGSNRSIRQSYDNSHKNISMNNLTTISSKKSMRSQHRRRRKSREEPQNNQEKKKRRDSRHLK